MLGGIAIKNGELVTEEQTRVSVDNLSFTYGHGAYENLIVRNRILSHPEEHIARLFISASKIGLHVPYTAQELLAQLRTLVQHIPDESFNIKLLVVGREVYLFAAAPKYLTKAERRDGVAVITEHAQRSFPSAKTLSMLGSFIAFEKAREAGAFDALLIDHEGRVLEGTRTNLFWTDGTTIYTAPDELVLAGVTRAHLIAALGDLPFALRALTQAELNSCAGLVLTSTSAGAVPVREIAARTMQIPALMREAIARYEAAEEKWRSLQTSVPAISSSTKELHKV